MSIPVCASRMSALSVRMGRWRRKEGGRDVLEVVVLVALEEENMRFRCVSKVVDLRAFRRQPTST